MKKIILDENIPHALKRLLGGHEVTAVQEQGWGGVENGDLLALIDGHFDIFITAEQNLRYQQNLPQRKIAIIELPFNARRKVLPLTDVILLAVKRANPGDYLQIAPPGER